MNVISMFRVVLVKFVLEICYCRTSPLKSSIKLMRLEITLPCKLHILLQLVVFCVLTPTASMEGGEC